MIGVILKHIFTVFEDPPEFRFETLYHLHCATFTRKTSGIVSQRGQEPKGKLVTVLYHSTDVKQEPSRTYSPGAEKLCQHHLWSRLFCLACPKTATAAAGWTMAALQISRCSPPQPLLPTPDLWGPLEFLKSPLISIKVWRVQGVHTAASPPLQRSQQILGNRPHFQGSRIFFLSELCFGVFFFLSFLNMIWNRKGKKVLNYFLSLLNVLMESMYMIVHFPDEWESSHVGMWAYASVTASSLVIL